MKLCVLVVDDNIDSAASLALIVSGWGHTVHTAHEGRSALETARRARPDIVILDLGMPGMSGYQLARLLRQEQGQERLRIIALTGHGTEEDRRRSREAGIDEHLVKPADPEFLRSLLAPRSL